MAQSTIISGPKMITFGTKSMIPSAATIKEPIDFDNIPDDMSNFQIKFGDKALHTLKHHPEFGYKFLPRVIGRNNTEFHTSKYLTPPELLSLFFVDITKDLPKHATLTLAVPSYYTSTQRQAIIDALKIYSFPVEAIVDDVSCLITLYGATRYLRYEKRSHNVMFIDIGATSFKVYGATFVWVGDESIANETVNEFSESVGGYFFAKAIAEHKNISFNKAEKIMRNLKSIDGYEEVLLPYINIINKTLRYATDKVSVLTNNTGFKKNSKRVDEVQIIGGCSGFPFIINLIKDATNCTNILKDFNAYEAIALGAVYHTEYLRNLTRFPPTQFARQQPFTLKVQCNATQNVCQRGATCKEAVYEKSYGCDNLYVLANPNQIGEGVNPVLYTYEMTNLSNIYFTRHDVGIGHIYFDQVKQRVAGVTWCRNQTCWPIASKVSHNPNPEMKHGIEFLKAYSKEENKRRMINKLAVDVEKLVSIINFDELENLPDLAWILRPIKADFDIGTLRSRTVKQLKSYVDDLKKVIGVLMQSIPPEYEDAGKVDDELSVDL